MTITPNSIENVNIILKSTTNVTILMSMNWAF